MILMIPQLMASREFGPVAQGRNQTKSGRLPELWRQTQESRETKAAIVTRQCIGKENVAQSNSGDVQKFPLNNSVEY